ncbi:hypothetical protein GCM10011351_23880 [Paraliobacillus quinghaiensis]|uniref:DUF393 domain-containing protein n=1 Tax=Paraliobacillus quinghaiensis TaxID=470815 RepID=A0A917WWS2_9BACI|nr:DUF393 domain-containing protein [Paraliobacillus quinghaiensis]GGM36924.1 hypothetical protein GCM10011351_23880 [Paraliobacillus quinghaiensis]
MSKNLILYDQYCYLCTQSKRIIKAFDWFRVFDWQSLQSYEKTTNLSEQKKEALKGEIHLIKPTGESLTGFYAIRYVLLRCLLTFWLGALFYLPKADRIGNPIYRWVAKNRYRMFKSKCKNGTCRIH